MTPQQQAELLRAEAEKLHATVRNGIKRRAKINAMQTAGDAMRDRLRRDIEHLRLTIEVNAFAVNESAVLKRIAGNEQLITDWEQAKQ